MKNIILYANYNISDKVLKKLSKKQLIRLSRESYKNWPINTVSIPKLIKKYPLLNNNDSIKK